MNKLHYLLLVSIAIATNSFAAPFTLTSPDLKPNQPVKLAQVLHHYGCEGQNFSPALAWSNAPTDTKSFAITVFDTDVPNPNTHGWWHWVIFNIPTTTHQLPSNASAATNGLPAGSIQVKNSFGLIGYGGPCPPKGDKAHHYVVTLYALKNIAPLSSSASVSEVVSFIKQNTLATAEIIAQYQR